MLTSQELSSQEALRAGQTVTNLESVGTVEHIDGTWVRGCRTTTHTEATTVHRTQSLLYETGQDPSNRLACRVKVLR